MVFILVYGKQKSSAIKLTKFHLLSESCFRATMMIFFRFVFWVITIVFKQYWVRIPVRLPLRMRKGNYFTFLFDHADSANIHLYSALCTQLEEGISHTLGTHLFLPLVTNTAFAEGTSHFYASLARFQISPWQSRDLRLNTATCDLFSFNVRGRFVLRNIH